MSSGVLDGRHGSGSEVLSVDVRVLGLGRNRADPLSTLRLFTPCDIRKQEKRFLRNR